MLRRIILPLTPCLLVLGCGGSPTTSPNTGESTTALRRAPQPAPTTSPDDADAAALRVYPAVTVIGVDVDCTETTVFFETDSAQLTDDDKKTLDRLALCLQGTAEKESLEVTGRADPRGTEPYNETLSRQRAEAVADYLQQQGVGGDSFEIRARGEQGMVENMPALWPVQRRATVSPSDSG